VTWDSSKGQSFGKQGEKMKHGAEKWVGRIVDTYSKKP
jgi:hypothetical protein